ncbi:alpha/beta hydrolase [Actinomadura sp. CNU-125]|uniref:alpha/beta hydrolase n=1 Tax=Actinomadura sp. CNU-125 TaxID=1904961 RepID=UPI0009F9DCA4|nr:alpha/beta hydrolase-fold protein [Actinomadura sp. CNU-125]
MKKRTDRKIAIIGTATAAVLLPALMVGLAQAGVGVPMTDSENAGASQPVPSFGPATQPGAPGMPTGPGSPSPTASPIPELPSRPMSTDPFNTGSGEPASNDPDTNASSHGKKPHLPDKVADAPSKYAKANDGAKITGVKKVGTRMYDVSIASPALGATVKTRMLMPKGWKAGAKRSWPVVYAYHGGNNNYQSWTKDSQIEQVVDDYDAIVVMPEGGWQGSYSNWWNDGKGGIPMWETFHIEEVIPLMERNFHAGTSRAAIGLSSGGQGAITYAQRNPGLFKYVASYSGALNITAPGVPAFLVSINKEAGTKIWGDPLTNRNVWRQHDATVMVEKLKGVGVYVSCGNGEPGPHDNPNAAMWDAGRVGERLAYRMNVNFIEAAEKAGVEVTDSLYGKGMHNWKYWRPELAKSFPMVAGAIGAKKL